MKTASIKVTPADPVALTSGRRFFRELVAAAEKVGRSRGWFKIAEFPDNPRRAYWYRARLKGNCGDRFEFTASTAKGVGKLYCRRSAEVQP